MQTLTEIKSLLAERGLAPRKKYGQNFLHDHNLIRKLVDAAGIRNGDLVLEVGPGTGTLTEELLERGAEVICCEIDPGFATLLRDRLGVKITLIEGDIMDKGRTLSPAVITALAGRPFTLIANLPYQIASPLIAALLINHSGCLGQFITIQKEVADRLTAKPSTKQYGPLGIIVQALATVSRIATLPPTCFWPPPDVTSAMISIHPRLDSPVTIPGAEGLARFITNLFTKRRKQLGTSLGRDQNQIWPEGVTPEQRPETLTVDQLIALYQIHNSDG